jgi:hypothetical protein
VGEGALVMDYRGIGRVEVMYIFGVVNYLIYGECGKVGAVG